MLSCCGKDLICFIFRCVENLHDALALSATCKQLRQIFLSLDKSFILRLPSLFSFPDKILAQLFPLKFVNIRRFKTCMEFSYDRTVVFLTWPAVVFTYYSLNHDFTCCILQNDRVCLRFSQFVWTVVVRRQKKYADEEEVWKLNPLRLRGGL
jgi:hypothetical protein